MEEEIAKIVSNAIAEVDNDLLFYKSELSQNRIEWIEKYLSKYLKTGKSLIELGCGSGKHIFKIEEFGLKVIGLEISKGMIDRANYNKKLLKSDANIIEGSYFNIPLKNCSVDYALFQLNIIECSYKEYEIICNETYRILEKGGNFFITLNQKKEHEIFEKDDKYNVLEGSYNGEINTPNKNGIKYPTYFWTISFMNFITTKKLKYKECITIDKKRTVLLIYGKI